MGADMEPMKDRKPLEPATHRALGESEIGVEGLLCSCGRLCDGEGWPWEHGPLCQECWDRVTSESWWATCGGVYKP